MPNHFHFAIRIKSKKDILAHSNLTFTKLNLKLNEYISKQFSKLFSSYTQSFNKQQNRQGTLFERPFKRQMIDNEVYFCNVIHYIHKNPVHHGFLKDLRDWKFSSYETFLSDRTTNIARKEVFNWFENKESFINLHEQRIDEKIALELEF